MLWSGGESWTLLSNLAKKHEINIVGGSVARLGPEGQILNTMYVLDPTRSGSGSV